MRPSFGLRTRTLKELLERIVSGEDLTQADAAAVIGAIMDGTMTPVQSAALLAALAVKGETADEIIGAARAMRERSLHVKHEFPIVVDVVGTGGDGANTLNVSTLAALTVAAAGVPVAKHGNRAASSSCGSADVLEAGGMNISIEPERAAAMLKDPGFTFMFAQRYHPAMKNVAAVRRELGIRTIFNLLGPLTNPASSTHQVVGVARASQVEPMGAALRAVGVRAGAVVHAHSGMDEIGGEGPTTVFQFEGDTERRWTLEPQTFGVRGSLDALRGGSLDGCRAAFADILAGEQSERSDVVALNAGVALSLAGKVATPREGFELARRLLHAGQVKIVFDRAAQVSHA